MLLTWPIENYQGEGQKIALGVGHWPFCPIAVFRPCGQLFNIYLHLGQVNVIISGRINGTERTKMMILRTPGMQKVMKNKNLNPLR